MPDPLHLSPFGPAPLPFPTCVRRGRCWSSWTQHVALFAGDGDDVWACDNRCPHEGYPLVEGNLTDGCILTCNWHNWKFGEGRRHNRRR